MTISSDTSRWYQGPAAVTLGGSALGDLQKGSGVEVTIEKQTLEAMADQFGESPVRVYNNGYRITAVVNLIERDYQTIKSMFPSATYTAGDYDHELRGNFTDETGNAAALVITPLDTDHSGDTLTIYLAYCTGVGPIGYSGDSQQVFAATFIGLVDVDNDNRIAVISSNES